MARSLADVKKAHGPRDYVADMKKALAAIPKGQYETSVELCYRSGISTKQIPELQPKFAAHSVQVLNQSSKPAWLWARTAADAKRLRDALKSQNG